MASFLDNFLRNSSTTQSRSTDKRTVASMRSQPADAKPEAPLVLRISLVGRGGSGKTVISNAIYKTIGQIQSRMGLQLDVESERDMAETIKQYRDTTSTLAHQGNPPTLDHTVRSFMLYKGATPCALSKFYDYVGQVFTQPDGSMQREEQFKELIKCLAQSDTLLAVIPSPPIGSNETDFERFNHDVNLLRVFIRGAINSPHRRRPLSVGLVMNKLDIAFGSEEEARAALTEQTLRDNRLFGSLISMLEHTDEVTHAGIFPVSSFGFNNAEEIVEAVEPVMEDDGEFEEIIDDAAVSYEQSEPIWKLKADRTLEPVNVAPLVLWSVMTSLLQQEVSHKDDGSLIVDLCRRLSQDFQDLNGWYIPLKGELV